MSSQVTFSTSFNDADENTVVIHFRSEPLKALSDNRKRVLSTDPNTMHGQFVELFKLLGQGKKIIFPGAAPAPDAFKTNADVALQTCFGDTSLNAEILTADSARQLAAQATQFLLAVANGQYAQVKQTIEGVTNEPTKKAFQAWLTAYDEGKANAATKPDKVEEPKEPTKIERLPEKSPPSKEDALTEGLAHCLQWHDIAATDTLGKKDLERLLAEPSLLDVPEDAPKSRGVVYQVNGNFTYDETQTFDAGHNAAEALQAAIKDWAGREKRVTPAEFVFALSDYHVVLHLEAVPGHVRTEYQFSTKITCTKENTLSGTVAERAKLRKEFDAFVASGLSKEFGMLEYLKASESVRKDVYKSHDLSGLKGGSGFTAAGYVEPVKRASTDDLHHIVSDKVLATREGSDGEIALTDTQALRDVLIKWASIANYKTPMTFEFIARGESGRHYVIEVTMASHGRGRYKPTVQLKDVYGVSPENSTDELFEERPAVRTAFVEAMKAVVKDTVGTASLKEGDYNVDETVEFLGYPSGDKADNSGLWCVRHVLRQANAKVYAEDGSGERVTPTYAADGVDTNTALRDSAIRALVDQDDREKKRALSSLHLYHFDDGGIKKHSKKKEMLADNTVSIEQVLVLSDKLEYEVVDHDSKDGKKKKVTIQLEKPEEEVRDDGIRVLHYKDQSAGDGTKVVIDVDVDAPKPGSNVSNTDCRFSVSTKHHDVPRKTQVEVMMAAIARYYTRVYLDRHGLTPDDVFEDGGSGMLKAPGTNAAVDALRQYAKGPDGGLKVTLELKNIEPLTAEDVAGMFFSKGFASVIVKSAGGQKHQYDNPAFAAEQVDKDAVLRTREKTARVVEQQTQRVQKKMTTFVTDTWPARAVKTAKTVAAPATSALAVAANAQFMLNRAIGNATGLSKYYEQAKQGYQVFRQTPQGKAMAAQLASLEKFTTLSGVLGAQFTFAMRHLFEGPSAVASNFFSWVAWDAKLFFWPVGVGSKVLGYVAPEFSLTDQLANSRIVTAAPALSVAANTAGTTMGAIFTTMAASPVAAAGFAAGVVGLAMYVASKLVGEEAPEPKPTAATDASKSSSWWGSVASFIGSGAVPGDEHPIDHLHL